MTVSKIYFRLPILIGVLLAITTVITFGMEYVVRVDQMELGKITTANTKNGWTSVSELEYGEKYRVETRTTYGKSGLFEVYEATFVTGDEVVAKILGTNKQNRISITVYMYYDDPKNPSVKTFTFDNSSMVILDNNFVIPHFEMMLKTPSPVFTILIPQALFDPSKTEKASGNAQLKRAANGKYVLSYEGVDITISTDKLGIVSMEYSNGITVERVKK